MSAAAGDFGHEGTLALEQRFGIVPEWIIDAAIGDCAFPPYAVLLRYGQSSGQRMPAELLAARLRKGSRDTVDRALKELGAAGAVTVEHRHDPRPGQLTNRYLVRSSLPGRKSAAPPSRKDAAPPAAVLRPDPRVLTESKNPPPAIPTRPPPEFIGPRRVGSPSCSGPAPSTTLPRWQRAAPRYAEMLGGRQPAGTRPGWSRCCARPSSSAAGPPWRRCQRCSQWRPIRPPAAPCAWPRRGRGGTPPAPPRRRTTTSSSRGWNAASPNRTGGGYAFSSSPRRPHFAGSSGHSACRGSARLRAARRWGARLC